MPTTPERPRWVYAAMAAAALAVAVLLVVVREGMPSGQGRTFAGLSAVLLAGAAVVALLGTSRRR